MTAQVGRVLGGRYRLFSAVGSGASAHVYLADDVRLGRRVAVKVLHPALADDESFLARFRAEARAAAALSHPHILAVYDWSGDDGTPYLVTEYLGGGSLGSMLDAGHRLTPAQALVVGLETARALDHAHRQGFVHRDIKPANLLFGEDGRLRVGDFGLARAIAEAGWTEPTGTMLGTARYASPEQARGEAVDGRSDVYSLALTLIEAVTGAVPFSADTTIGTLMARLDHPLEVPDELGPLAPVVERAGRAEPGERIDAAAFGAGLVGAAGELSRPAPLPLVRTNGVAAPTDQRDSTLVRPDLLVPGIHGNGAAGAVPDPLGVTQLRGPAPGAPGGLALGGADAGATSLVAAAPDGDATGVMPQAPRLPPPPAEPPRTPLPPTGGGGVPAPPPPPLSAGDRSARRLMLGAVVVAVAVAIGVVGAVVYLQLQVPSHRIPTELIGAQQDGVLDVIGGNGWDIETQRAYYDDTQPGEVVRTAPQPGTMLREGETLTLYVSLGPPLVAVPQDLAGMTRAEAEARLGVDGIELEPDFVEQVDDDVDRGIVLGLGPDVPAELPRGSTVQVLVSAGDDEVEVPDVEGKHYLDAAEELESLGLEVELEHRRRGDRDDGEVIRTEPGEGEQVDPGSTVVLVVAGSSTSSSGGQEDEN